MYSVTQVNLIKVILVEVKQVKCCLKGPLLPNLQPFGHLRLTLNHSQLFTIYELIMEVIDLEWQAVVQEEFPLFGICCEYWIIHAEAEPTHSSIGQVDLVHHGVAVWIRVGECELHGNFFVKCCA